MTELLEGREYSDVIKNGCKYYPVENSVPIEVGDTVSFKYGDNYSMGEVIRVLEDRITVRFRADNQERTLLRNEVILQWKKEEKGEM